MWNQDKGGEGSNSNRLWVPPRSGFRIDKEKDPVQTREWNHG